MSSSNALVTDAVSDLTAYESPRWLDQPNRAVSLWSMLTFFAFDFCRASGMIGQLYAQVRTGVMPTQDSWGLIASELGELERACESLGLRTTLAQIRRIKPTFMTSGSVDFRDLARNVMEVQTRLIDELEGRTVLLLDPTEQSLYSAPLADWRKIVARFPVVTDDVDEAAKCLALGRYPAAIFHLMRITEAGVVTLGALVDQNDHKPQFSSVLRKLDALIQKTKWQDWPDDARPHKQLFAEVLPRLYAVKDSWRDKVSHVDTHIVPTTAAQNRERAQDVYNCTASLMNLLTERLPDAS